MTKIKFCGFTQIYDVYIASSLGVDYLGFVRHPESKRFVSLETAEYLSTESHMSNSVLVYQNFVSDASLKGFDVQAQDFSSWNLPSGSRRIVSVSVQVSTKVQPVPDSLIRSRDSGVSPKEIQSSIIGVLLDAYHPTEAGGTGTVIDWDWASSFVSQSAYPVILAGGLTPDNVAEAIRIVRPYAVDVSSGIESSPGIKDHGKMKAFVEAVRSAG